MQNTFFTSDTHYFHKNIISFAKRPFESVAEMNSTMVNRWNEMVGKNDIVYHLGDFSMGNSKMTREILYSLNGKIRLVRGNHDKAIRGSLADRFEWVKDYYETKAPDGRKVILCHYAFQVWNKSHYGSWHLYGHSHGSLEYRDIKRLDVGVDTNNFYPYSFDDIKRIMDKRGISEVDHHKTKDKYK